jgi:adenosylmethionine-8-amino-7-oxononanoate aminotransferase
VVVRPLGEVVVLNPPLSMSDAEAEVLVDAVAAAITEVIARRG